MNTNELIKQLTTCLERPVHTFQYPENVQNQIDLFEKVALFGDKQLSKAILRLVIKLEIENYERINGKKIGEAFEPKSCYTPFRDIKLMNYCWDLGRILVDVVSGYARFNDVPDFDVFEAAIVHEDFCDFVYELFWVTRGSIT